MDVLSNRYISSHFLCFIAFSRRLNFVQVVCRKLITRIADLVVFCWPRVGHDGYEFQWEGKHDCVTVLRDSIQCLKKPQLKSRLMIPDEFK